VSHDIDPFTKKLIRWKAGKLTGWAGLRPQDRPDLEQEFAHRVLRSERAYSPERAAREPFISAVIKNAASNVLRHRRADKRYDRRTGSLNVLIWIEDIGVTELGAAISGREYDARRRSHPRSDAELAQLKFDIAFVLSTLPPDLRELAEKLMRMSVAETARELGVPRTTLYESIRRLRRRFEIAGLRKYL
jgi:RNA polymerase sigma-70 factor (ECF subfamily)